MAGQTSKRSTNWTESERLVATEMVIARSDSLFGKFRGATLGKHDKDKQWSEIADELNASGKTSTLRTVPEIKKMYNNVKCRAKEKASQVSKTGGGPAPSLGCCEDMVLKHLMKHNNSQMVGVDGGIESECASTPATSETTTYIAPEVEGYTVENTVTLDGNVVSTYTANSSMILEDTPASASVDNGPSSIERSTFKSNKRRREDGVDELYNLEKRRILAEIEYFEERKQHSRELYAIQKELLQLQLAKLKKKDADLDI